MLLPWSPYKDLPQTSQTSKTSQMHVKICKKVKEQLATRGDNVLIYKHYFIKCLFVYLLHHSDKVKIDSKREAYLHICMHVTNKSF